MSEAPHVLSPAVLEADAVVREWPEVRVRSLFGHHSWQRGHSVFAWALSDGVVIGKLSGHDLGELLATGVRPVQHGGASSRGWYFVPMSESGVDAALGWLRRAYESVGDGPAAGA